MKSFLTLIIVAVTAISGYSQEIKQRLRPFDKIVVSPKINLILIPGETESIRIEYTGVDPDKIIIDQTHHRKVHVYLENAKVYDIGERHDDMFDRKERYKRASITAYVTFKSLRLIETRGEGQVVCDGKINSRKLKLRAYGETEIRLAYVNAENVMARLYGENKLSILDGEAGHLSYRVYGTNKVESRGLKSVTSSTTIFGEGRISLYATEEVHVTSFGEPSLYVSGSPVVSKGIVIGRTNIRRN
jgi:hypothetical protein